MCASPARRHQPHQFRSQSLRTQKTTPGQLHPAAQDRFADLDDMAGEELNTESTMNA